ncbi:MAG: hypothetical protein HZB91_12840, partial [Elusimicrobia bacterium]|nr:hypothetical protein [Elusimicrobiota bacterium]
MLALVARGLRELKDQVVFVGGATVELYMAGPGAEPLRVTDDVDCVIGITSRAAYGALEEKLRALGFSHPTEEPKAPICRWKYSGIPVDVMPIDAAVLGFSNRWYSEGILNAEKKVLPDGQGISVFSLPYFLASKLEAFMGRGKGDFYGSKDIEDIIVVVDGAREVRESVLGAPEAVRACIREEFSAL